MPFKSLAGLRKVANLGAEVTAVAALENAQIVAALSTDPVKVLTQPYGSTSGKTTQVSLDQASQLALLTKNVAVVKCGDDLWALLDITHTPKMDQVGRDIRALVSCPKGETALAIGWDGQGAALAFQNNEVGGRQFVLRGELRVAALSMDATYVVAEGGGGGQFRAHPGLTPESAAVTRADLPPTATGFDRLAGGHQLSALTGRGGDSVCVVVREGAAALTVKTIQVDGGVVDVAVIETSLFVLGADGKLRLYGQAALAAASDGGVARSTFELDLRAQGAPTVLMATMRGGNRLWIGTKGGDLLRCDAVKGELDL
jgi:hypothetical protein